MCSENAHHTTNIKLHTGQHYNSNCITQSQMYTKYLGMNFFDECQAVTPLLSSRTSEERYTFKIMWMIQ